MKDAVCSSKEEIEYHVITQNSRNTSKAECSGTFNYISFIGMIFLVRGVHTSRNGEQSRHISQVVFERLPNSFLL